MDPAPFSIRYTPSLAVGVASFARYRFLRAAKPAKGADVQRTSRGKAVHRLILLVTSAQPPNKRASSCLRNYSIGIRIARPFAIRMADRFDGGYRYPFVWNKGAKAGPRDRPARARSAWPACAGRRAHQFCSRNARCCALICDSVWAH